jgi:hypothetical protein
MKTATSKLVIRCLFLSVLFSSCTKEEDLMTTKTILLVQKDWKVESHGLDENNNGIIEESENTMLDCEADDIYTFNMNCTGVFSGGTMSCSEGEPPLISFNWRFLNHGAELAVFAAPERILRLDENYLEVYYMDENLWGQPVKYIRRFRH